MVDHSDFKDIKGNTDWSAYKKEASKAAGEMCIECGRYLTSLSRKEPRKCQRCLCLDIVTDQTSHPEFIRCPSCKDTFNAHEDGCDHPEIFEDGTHTILCDECGYEIEVQTDVSYNFTSPKLCDGVKQ